MREQAELQREALRRMAADDPALAARLVLMVLPAAAARIPDTLAFELRIAELGDYRVLVADGAARVDPGGGEGHVDFRLPTDAAALVDLVTGAARPFRLMLGGRLRIRGKRRRALKLRAMGTEAPDIQDVVRSGGQLDPDVLYRALPYLVDPEWTKGHNFTIRYEVTGESGGTWFVEARDGQPLRVTTETPGNGAVTSTAKG